MKRVAPWVSNRVEIFKEHKLTIGVDLGDRFSHYCVLNGAGEVIWKTGYRRRRKESTKSLARFRAVGSH
jgi:predicted NBD/HSP70 family sugar kinase